MELAEIPGLDLTNSISPSKDRLKQLFQAIDHPSSNYAPLPEAEKTRLKADLLALAKRLGIRIAAPKPRAPRHTHPADRPADIGVEPVFADLFDQARWPHRPYCSDDLSRGLTVRSLWDAIKKPYIQANPPHLRVWSLFDIDRPSAATAWEDAGLPPPAWTTVNKENGHAHMAYGLTAPVLLEAADARRAPMRYLCAVEAAMRAALQSDQDYSGLITKNPAHPLWHTLRGPRTTYDLGELAEYLDLPKHMPKRKPEEIGLGRNVALFDWLRHYAYRNIRRFKETKGCISNWRLELDLRALERNGEFASPLCPQEVGHIAKSVAKWTWVKFDIEASDKRFKAIQAHRGRASGAARLAASEDKRASARLMHAQGMSNSEIARVLDVKRPTLISWLKKSLPPCQRTIIR